MKNKSLLFIIILLHQISCNKVESTFTSNRYLTLDVNNIVEYNYSSLFDTCFVIPLETKEDSYIGKIDKVIVTDRSIIILDSRMAKSIFFYNLNGNLEKVISKLGEGPTEYMHPANISVAQNGEELILLDSRGMKVIFYSIDGEYIKEIKLSPEQTYADLISEGESIYITGADFYNKFKNVGVLNKDFVFQSSISTTSTDDLWIVNGMKTNYLFEKASGKGFYYKGWYTNRILEIVDNNVVEDIQITFSKNAFQFDSNNSMEAKEFIKRLSDEETYITSNHIIDGKYYMLFDILKGSKSYLGVWNKKSDKAYLASFLQNDMDGVFPKISSIFPFNSNSNYFITMIYPDYFNDKKQNGFLDGKYKKLLEGIDVVDEDNPILFIYKFKDSI